ncbi:MAG: HlyD family type I secretion periplasmic adaptor subunit [Magnetococcales bacterium]|nr:HlyD family type I secretion periplasmic adaptor subunit [Magnetococcales bacterium]
MNDQWDNSQFMSEADAARQNQAHPFAHMLLFLIALFLGITIVWASMADLDEVTVGFGKVVPSGQVKVVQSLEGGILAEMSASEGEIVNKDQVLLNIDDTQFQASFRESRSKFLGLTARAARLEAEANDAALRIPKVVLEEKPELAGNEEKFFESHKKELKSTVSMLENQVEQRQHELNGLIATEKQLRHRLELSRKELHLTEPMVKQGIMSEVELLRMRREVAELEGNLETTILTIPRTRSMLEEAKIKVKDPTITFRSKAQLELNEVRSELNQLTESLTGLQDRVRRTAIRSPVRGTVIRVRVHSIGQVIRSGMDLVEIMPLDDSLLVEAQIRPADIAFLRPGQKTMVKFTAYDFSIYGGLVGHLEQISADAIANEKGESFFKILVRTQVNHLGTPERPLPIIPGMVATTDILTGKKSVLDYLLKPILKAKANALRER